MALRDTVALLVGLLLLSGTWEAGAAVDLEMKDRVEVFRGQTANISCLFKTEEGVGGITIMWFFMTRSGERQKIYFQDSTMQIVDGGTPFTDRISVSGSGAHGKVELSIQDVRLEDELDFICFVQSLTDGNKEGRTRLRVFEKPNQPTIEAVETGFEVNNFEPSKIAVCEVRNGFPRPNITWYRDNTPLRAAQDEVLVVPSTTTESSGLISVSSELSIKVEKEDKDAKFYCEVNYDVPGGMKMMMETDRINITVLYPSTTLTLRLESPQGKIKEGDTIKVRCQGDGTSQSSELTMSHPSGDDTLEGNTFVLENVTRLNTGTYTCTSLDLAGPLVEISKNITVFVNYLEPVVLIPENLTVKDGGELKATCNALSSLQTHTAWFKNGVEISKGHTLILENSTLDTAGTYQCVVSVPEVEGMVTRGSLIVQVEGKPEIVRPDVTEIESSENLVELSCLVRGFPAPSIMWSSSDAMALEETSQDVTERWIQSTAWVKVTSEITAVCEAANEHGTDTLTFKIKPTKHTTTQAAATTTSTAISVATVKAGTALPIPPKKIKKEGSGVIIAVLIICILLLAILGSVLYFLYKKGKICGRSGKQDLTKEKSSKDNIVVEMKSDNTEEAILLGVNGEKLLPSDQ